MKLKFDPLSEQVCCWLAVAQFQNSAFFTSCKNSIEPVPGLRLLHGDHEPRVGVLPHGAGPDSLVSLQHCRNFCVCAYLFPEMRLVFQ